MATQIIVLSIAAVQKTGHATDWKAAPGVEIREPRKEDYRKLKSYSTISLLMCMGNVVDKVVPVPLSNEGKRRVLLSHDLFVSRKKKLAIDVATILIYRAYSQSGAHNINGVLLMDINEVFPSMVSERLTHAIKAKRIDRDLLQCITIFL